MVGTELNLKIHQAPDAVVGGRTVHVFQFAANVEDRVLLFRSVMDYAFFQRSASKFYDCHGEVWMDESGIILRISEAFDLSGPWYRAWIVMTYGWLEKNGTQYLVPVTIAAQAEHKNMYWCRGLFTDYEMFGVKPVWCCLRSRSRRRNLRLADVIFSDPVRCNCNVTDGGGLSNSATLGGRNSAV